MTHKLNSKFSYKHKNKLLLLLILPLSGCLGCHYFSSDNTTHESTKTTPTEEEVHTSEIVAATIGADSGLIIDYTESTKDLAILLSKDAEIRKERAQNAKTNLDTSRVVKEFGQDCTAVLAKYTKVINKFAESGDESVLDEILAWQNDLMFIYCTKQETHKAAFQKLNEILE